MIHKVKLAKRAALLRLNNQVCHVRLKGWGRDFTTNGKLLVEDAPDGSKISLTYIDELHEYHNVKHIREIEVESTRFTPDVMCWMEVDWDE